MKRTINWQAIVAVVLAVLVPAAGLAQTVVETIDYEGSWVIFEQQGFKLYLPNGWQIAQAADTGKILLLNETATASMWVEVMAGDGYTLEGILEAFSQAKGFSNVQLVYFGGVPFVTYTLEADDLFGAVTLSADYASAVFFKFMPYSDTALTSLAVKIMATLTPAV